MSDEIEDLVGWLLDWPYQGETMAQEAAVLIKALTAEREALEQDNHRWKMECENFWRDREKDLTAERDRLRALVWAALDAWDIQDKDGGPMGDHWVSDARAALKGETP